MTRWPRLPRRGVGVDRCCVRVTWTGRSGSADAAGGIRDIRGEGGAEGYTCRVFPDF